MFCLEVTSLDLGSEHFYVNDNILLFHIFLVYAILDLGDVQSTSRGCTYVKTNTDACLYMCVYIWTVRHTQNGPLIGRCGTGYSADTEKSTHYA